MSKRGNTGVDGYRWRLQLALLGSDIMDVMNELKLPTESLTGSNRYELLRLWDDRLEEAIIRKLRERLRPR